MSKLSKYFSRDEFACKCNCGFATVDVELLKLLEVVRMHFGQPVTINSGCRCPKHNSTIGALNSKHLQGIAADIVVKNTANKDVYEFIDKHAPNKYGLGLYPGFVHVDVRPNKARF